MNGVPHFSVQGPWLHDGSVSAAIDWHHRIDEAPDVGYVYVLALAGGHTKVGATAYFPERLRIHRRDFRRCGLGIERCLVTRPAFNYREVELTAKRRFADRRFFGEVIAAPVEDVADFIERQPLEFVAPIGYGRSRPGAHRFLKKLMADISAGLGQPLPEGLQRSVRHILDRHTALGRETGLSERDSTLNALAVIEAHTGLDLSTFRHVLREVA